MTNTDTRCLTCGHDAAAHVVNQSGRYCVSCPGDARWHPFVPAPSTRCLTCGQRIREVVDERDNRRWIHDSVWHTPIPAPSTDNEPYGDARRKDRAIEVSVPSTTDAVEAARSWDRLDDALTKYDDFGFFHRYILWEDSKAKFTVDVPLDVEAAIVARERERYENERAETADIIANLLAECHESEARIEALEAVVEAARRVNDECVGHHHGLWDAIAALDKEAK